ncbi:MAG: PLP-dependent aminotransferase family protein [Pirellula sp.]
MARRQFASIFLDRRSAVSLQDQLSFDLKQRIQTGVLKAGDELPSSRELANELRVSRNTVIAAYDRLLGEGYLDALARSGVYVSSALQDMPQAPVIPTNRGILKTTSDRIAVPTLAGPLAFRPSQPDVRLFPVGVWNRMRNRAMRRFGSAILHYQSKHSLGLPVLRQALAEYLVNSRGVRCHWSQIAITTGSQQALYLLGQLLLKRGDTVLIEDPGYIGARSAFERTGARLRGMEVDVQGVVPPKRAARAKLIYTTPSRQFPTGACLQVSRRMAMLEFAKSAGAWLIEDDYDSEFRYSRPPMPSLRGLDASGRVIYVGSMSKVLYPSLRIGYVVLPDELVSSFESLRLIVEDHGPLIDQATLAEFLSSGAFYTHVRRCRKMYAARLETFLGAATKCRLPLEFPFTDGGMNQAGFFANPEVDAKWVEAAIEQAGLFVPSMSRYSLRPSRPGLLFGFTAFDHAMIRSSMSTVGRVLAKIE